MFTMRKATAIRNFVNLFENIRNKSTTTKFAKNLEHLKKWVWKFRYVMLHILMDYPSISA